ncbi:hypothetical protein D9M71_808640 [compost metagenome]
MQLEDVVAIRVIRFMVNSVFLPVLHAHLQDRRMVHRVDEDSADGGRIYGEAGALDDLN